MIKISYEKLKRDCELLAKLVANGDRAYSNIFAVPRGGVPIGIYLSELLKLPLVSEDEITEDTLIVDDLIDSGRTYEKYKQYGFACLYLKRPLMTFNITDGPTYIVEVLEDWIELPYEKTGQDEEDIIVRLLEVLGEDPTREGLLETPKRVLKFYKQFLNPPEFNFTAFENEGTDQMIIQKDIPFFSLCEHHMAPFFGKATVAYIPGEKIVGLSKLARTVQLYANKLQNQERITTQVAERLQEELSPLGVAVSLTGRHFCMEMRGVKTHDVNTTTTKLIGAFKDQAEARAEFMAILRG